MCRRTLHGRLHSRSDWQRRRPGWRQMPETMAVLTAAVGAGLAPDARYPSMGGWRKCYARDTNTQPRSCLPPAVS
jgi:hypothetical protein